MKFFLILFVFVSLYSSEYCIVVASYHNLSQSVKSSFLKRFQNGKVEKYGSMYEFKIAYFSKYKEAKKTLKIAHKYYNDAFIINCEKKVENKKESILITKLDKILPKNSLFNKNISRLYDTPKLNEPNILKEYKIPKLSKIDESQIYDVISFKRYINTIFTSNDKVKDIFYKKKIDYILTEIAKDKYNFNLYISTYARTGTSVATATGTTVANVASDYTNVGVSLNADKLIYDGGYSLLHNQYEILNKRLSDINELNSKDRLLILGANIYSNLYSAQENLKIIKKLYSEQLKITNDVEEQYKKGKVPVLSMLDSKNDLLNLKKRVLLQEYSYLVNDYIFRHTIKSKSKKGYKLYSAIIKLNLNSLAELEKKAVSSSLLIAREGNLLKLRQTDYLFQKNRYNPIVRFNSFLGYGISRDKVFNLENSSKGNFWSLGFTLTIPLYARNDIKLNKQKEFLTILRQKSIVSSTQRVVLSRVENIFYNIKRLDKVISILKEQLYLSEQKLSILKEKLNVGVAKYVDYSKALNQVLRYKTQLIDSQQKKIIQTILLGTIIGKRDFYE